MNYPFLNRQTVIRTLPIIDRYRVSLVARGIRKSRQTEKGFLQVWLKKQPLSKMATKGTTWNERRNAFIKRHLKARGKLYNRNGYPTRKHLALIAWGYSPDPKGLARFLDAIDAKNRNISDYVRM